jgi:hypothetical protein
MSIQTLLDRVEFKRLFAQTSSWVETDEFESDGAIWSGSSETACYDGVFRDADKLVSAWVREGVRGGIDGDYMLVEEEIEADYEYVRSLRTIIYGKHVTAWYEVSICVKQL